MLPQMMPLPWLFVFFMIFMCFFSIIILLNFFPMEGSETIKIKTVSTYYTKMSW